MHIISFNPFRSLGIPHIKPIKPEAMFCHKEEISKADWILFPEYWQVNGLVYVLKKRIFPSINTYHLGHDKVQMTRAFWALCPENVPRTKILASDDTGMRTVLDEFDFPFVAKEIRNSMGRGVYLIQSLDEWITYVRSNQILYVQEYLSIGRDMRLIVIGNRVVAAYWREKPEGGFHTNVACGGRVIFDHIPQEVVELIEQVSSISGINHAGFDVAEENGRYYILEFNPFFGHHGPEIMQIKICDLIHEYLRQKGTPSQPSCTMDDTALPLAS